MKKDNYPKEMLKSRTKTWLNVNLPELLQQIPSRHRKVFAKIDLTKSKYPLQSTYMSGKVRTGKTVKAWQMTLEWHKDQYIRRLSKDFYFLATVQLLTELRNTYNNPDPSINEAQILKKYKKVKLLVLDDFAVEKTTEWAFQMLYMILNHRYEHELATIYTSNFSLNELTKRLGDERLTSRIGHECKGNIITFTNKPYI